jgi:hypothetical protein
MLHSAVVRCAKNLAVVGVLSLTAHIAAARSFQIGSSNMVTADPPVSRPHVKPCVVTLFAGLQFVDFSVPTYQTSRHPLVQVHGRKSSSRRISA